MARHGGRLFVVMILLAAAIAGVVAYRLVVGGKQRHEICVQVEVVKKLIREDKRTQLSRSLAYLKVHPNGAPGIPRKLILQSIHDQRHTLRQLRPVKC